jgi:hypothetical protein
VISVHGSQKDARNIEQGFAPEHRIVNYLQEDETEGHHNASTTKSEASTVSKTVIELGCETKRIPLDPRVPGRTIMIFQDLSLEEETELLLFLDRNSGLFAC